MKYDNLLKLNGYITVINLTLGVLAVLLLLLGPGCAPQSQTATVYKGDPGADGVNGKDGQGCSVVQIPVGDLVLPKGGAVVLCGHSSVLISNGADGLNGAKGDTGDQGLNGEVGPRGPKGDPGSTGPQGTQGTPGANGNDGHDAPASSYGILGMVDPCGPQSSYDEVFLRLANGHLIALFTDNIHGDNPRLSEIGDGSFMTTDGTNCYFSISILGGVRTISWTGGSESWTM